MENSNRMVKGEIRGGVRRCTAGLGCVGLMSGASNEARYALRIIGASGEPSDEHRCEACKVWVEKECARHLGYSCEVLGELEAAAEDLDEQLQDLDELGELEAAAEDLDEQLQDLDELGELEAAAEDLDEPVSIPLDGIVVLTEYERWIDPRILREKVIF